MIIKVFVETLKEEAMRILFSEDGGAPGLFEACLRYLETLSDAERTGLYDTCADEAERVAFEEGSEHRAWPIGEYDGHCVYLMLWGPNACTRPHNHNGSRARIYVLRGSFVQLRYKIGTEYGKFREEAVGHCGEGEDVQESPDDIHALANYLPSGAITLHEFDLAFMAKGMTVFDLEGSEMKWTAKPGESSRPGIPEDAVPIWPDDPSE